MVFLPLQLLQLLMTMTRVNTQGLTRLMVEPFVVVTLSHQTQKIQSIESY
jgi:hypothetical protein